MAVETQAQKMSDEELERELERIRTRRERQKESWVNRGLEKAREITDKIGGRVRNGLSRLSPRRSVQANAEDRPAAEVRRVEAVTGELAEMQLGNQARQAMDRVNALPVDSIVDSIRLLMLIM